jgi:hypothetical protein
MLHQDYWRVGTLCCAVALALPAAMLLAWFWGSRHRNESCRAKMPVVFWSTLIALGMFLLSIPNIFLSGSRLYRSNHLLYELGVAFMLVWPVFGILTTVAGIALARLARPGQRWKFVISNILLFILSFSSFVAPN